MESRIAQPGVRPERSTIDWQRVAGALLDESRDDIESLVSEVEPAQRLLEALDERLEAARRARGRGSEDGGLTETCREALEAVRGSPGDGPVLVACVYLVVLDAWERTGMWSELDAVISELDDAIVPFVTAPDGEGGLDAADARVLEGLRLRLTRMQPMLEVESALNLSAAGEMKKQAGAVRESARKALEWAENVELPAELEPVRRELRRSACADGLYYDCIVSTAAAVEAFHERSASGGDVAAAIDKLERVERDGLIASGPVQQSELRAHRLTLNAFAESADKPCLHVDRARVVYCYPFRFRYDLDWTELGEKLESNPWLSSDGKTIRVENVRPMPLTDMWRYDVDDDHGFQGIELQLAGPRLASADEEVEYDVTIRLSTLGNHYLRVERDLDDARLHEVYVALRRGARECGQEPLRVGDLTWKTTLCELADTAIRGLVALAAPADDAAHPAAEAAERRTPFPERQTSCHTVLSISELSVVSPPDEPRPATAADLAVESGVVGLSLLGQPVRQYATALDEWVRYPLGDVLDENLFADRGFAGDIAVGTSNTTVFLLTTMPGWLLDEYEEIAAFAASLPPSFELEKRNLAKSLKLARELNDALPRGEKARRGNTVVDPWKYEQHTLDLGQRAVRVQASLVRSGDLVRGAVHRSFLDEALKRSTVPQLEREIMTGLDRLSSLFTNLTAEAQIIRERYAHQRREDARRKLEVVLAVLGALAFFHMWTFLNESFEWREIVAGAEFALTLLIAVLLGLWVRHDLGSSSSGDGDDADTARPR